MATTAEILVQACIAAATRGDDFPTVWRTILKGHPAVVGLPTQRMDGGVPHLEIRLISGERIAVGPGKTDYAIAGALPPR